MKCDICGHLIISVQTAAEHYSEPVTICPDCQRKVAAKIGDWLQDEYGNYYQKDVIPIEKNKPHKVSKVVCLKCLYMWLAVRPEETLLTDLECPNLDCGCQGYVIETGEIINA